MTGLKVAHIYLIQPSYWAHTGCATKDRRTLGHKNWDKRLYK